MIVDDDWASPERPHRVADRFEIIGVSLKKEIERGTVARKASNKSRVERGDYRKEVIRMS